jgi:hypothetical protein
MHRLMECVLSEELLLVCFLILLYVGVIAESPPKWCDNLNINSGRFKRMNMVSESDYLEKKSSLLQNTNKYRFHFFVWL